jgi:hypothetical protein
MTAAAVPARPAQARPAMPGLTRLIWVTWRQHRMALAGVGILLGAGVAALAVTGLRIRSAQAALAHAGCQTSGALLSSQCGHLENNLYRAGYPLSNNVPLVAIMLMTIPALIGMFAGAPLLAREYETGAFRFSWTQAVGRTRWVSAKLVLLGAVLAVAACAFGAVAGWWLSNVDTILQAGNSPWQPGQFGLTVVTFAGWTVLAFALGAFLGTAIRRTVPAMAATAAAYAALAGGAFWKVTAWLTSLGPVSRVTSVVAEAPFHSPVNNAGVLPGAGVASSPVGSWPLQLWFTQPGGQRVSVDSSRLNTFYGIKESTENSWLAAHHFTLWISYQPAGRFWLFQSVLGGGCLLLAAAFGAATMRLAGRRAG